MTQVQPPRGAQAGVTMIEMLVVLALFAVVAGAVALSLPGQRTDRRDGFDRLALKARLDATVRRTLTRAEPFALWQTGDDLLVLVRGDAGEWEIARDPELNPVKLISRHERISFKYGDDDVYAVSPALVPDRRERLLVNLGDTEDAYFDGVVLGPAPTEEDNAQRAER